MIYCICNKVSYQELNEYLEKNEPLSNIKKLTNLGATCGTCLKGGEEQFVKEVRRFKLLKKLKKKRPDDKS